MSKNKSEKINESLPIEQREGQVGINNQGLEMKITRYSKLEGEKYYTIDIKFLIDGYTSKHKQYGKFLTGEIRNYNFPNSKFIDRTGERRQNNQGYWMTITECYGYSNIIVTFEDDGSKKNSDYGNFKNGKIKHPFKFTDSLLYKYPKLAEAIAIPENNLTLEDTAHMYPNVGEFYVKCLECEKVSSKKKKLNDLTRRIFSCEYCSDNISMPNKMLRQFDNQLDLGLQFEYSPEWLGKYRFDAYDDNLKIAIEMDAEWGKNHRGERKAIDNWKDKMANEHGIEVIRIDLMDTNKYRNDILEYIKQQLLSSKLNDLYDLDKVDWNKAWLNCQKSLMIEACKLWQEGYVVSDISKKIKLSKGTIVIYLNRGYKLGLCDYTKEKAKKEQGKKTSGINNYGATLYWVIKSDGKYYSDKPLCGQEIYNKGFLHIGYRLFQRYIVPYNNLDINRIIGDNYQVKQTREKLAPFDSWQFIPLTKEEKENYLKSLDIK